MPAAVKTALEGVTGDNGELERIIPEWERSGKDKTQVPACLSKVPRDTVKNFPHTKRVGSYLVGKMINKGSFAKVMEGLHISTGEKVAIKVIDKKKAKQDSYVLRNMKREPRIHQMVKHPNIVQLYETLETENSYYMVMELCQGGDLMDRICDRKRLEEKEVRRYTRQIMSAVEHLHRHGIVHRDLKIENFLLDEFNNIKIVDFGLSNTLKVESLSLELLNTQCGSPAYAAPELLAHKKYGPKVDVWSIGVSMFAMLTGTLPFTVEPFNIKQLHQKMANGEISAIPSDISKGAVQFMLSLLEPDPTKRPAVKEAMEDKWLNEGYIKRPLNSVFYKNRLRPDEMNSVVLNYMTESLDYALSDVISTMINNRPSAIMATYCLLVKKLARHQKGVKTIKKLEQSDCNLTKKTGWIEFGEKANTGKKIHPKKETAVEKNRKESSKPLWNPFHQTESLSNRKKTEDIPRENLKSIDKTDPSSSLASASVDVIAEDEIAVTLENKDEYFAEVSNFANRELIHLVPPECTSKEEPSHNPCQSDSSETQGHAILCKETSVATKPQRFQEQRASHSDNTPLEPINCHAEIKMEKLHPLNLDKGVSPRLLVENKGHNKSPALHQDTRFKDLLQAMDPKVPALAWRCPEKEGRHFTALESAQLSPLPKLRHTALKDNISRRITWVGTTKNGTGGSPPFLVNGSRPPSFPSSRQQTLIVKSLRHSKERGRNAVSNSAAKRNSIQIRHTHRVADWNLPALSPAFHSKSDKKSELLRMDFG
nr:PREDICTED: hormonally up-regulated neu tumor-associated kinase homolog A-like [Lepisosteus oculatus]